MSRVRSDPSDQPDAPEATKISVNGAQGCAVYEGECSQCGGDIFDAYVGGRPIRAWRWLRTVLYYKSRRICIKLTH